MPTVLAVFTDLIYLYQHLTCLYAAHAHAGKPEAEGIIGIEILKPAHSRLLQRKLAILDMIYLDSVALAR